MTEPGTLRHLIHNKPPKRRLKTEGMALEEAVRATGCGVRDVLTGEPCGRLPYYRVGVTGYCDKHQTDAFVARQRSRVSDAVRRKK